MSDYLNTPQMLNDLITKIAKKKQLNCNYYTTAT